MTRCLDCAVPMATTGQDGAALDRPPRCPPCSVLDWQRRHRRTRARPPADDDDFETVATDDDWARVVALL